MFDQRIEWALDLCYEAVAAPEQWTSALDGLAAATGAGATMFYPKDVNENANKQLISSDYQGLLDDYVANGWYENHYRAERGWPLLMRSGSHVVVTEHDLATDEERRRLPHYNELYLKWGFSGFAAIGFWVEGNPWCLPILRSERQGFFSRQEARALAGLAPHLARLVRLGAAFEGAQAASGIEALAVLKKPAFLLEADGRIVETNAPARALLAEPGRGLVETRGRLRAVESRSNQRLRDLVATAAIFEHRLRRNLQASAVRIERPGRRPLIAEVVSAREFVGRSVFRPRAVLLVRDPESGVTVRAEELSSLIDLTPAEARLAAKLAQGADLAESAAALGITRSTARDRLKRVFLKTGTHRQAELVTLLRALAG